MRGLVLPRTLIPDPVYKRESVSHAKEKVYHREMSRARNWCITINNPQPEERAVFVSERFRAKIKYYIYQVESGENGTPHIQGYVCFNSQIRQHQVKAFFPRAHLEIARGKPADNKAYCSKEDGRIDGPYEYGDLPEGQGRRSDLKEFRTAVLNEELSELDMYDRYPDVVAKYRDFCRTCVEHGREKRRREGAPPFNPRAGWQIGLQLKLDAEPDRRKVHWYYDEIGNTGKSFFALNYRSPDGRYGYIVTGGRHSDIYAGYKDEKVVFFDWARDNEDGFPYRVVENFKNGYFLSTKYQVVARRFDPVHIVVFANFAPDQAKLSADRWDIHHILQM